MDTKQTPTIDIKIMLDDKEKEQAAVSCRIAGNDNEVRMMFEAFIKAVYKTKKLREAMADVMIKVTLEQEREKAIEEKMSSKTKGAVN